jgi:hypothetical protein
LFFDLLPALYLLTIGPNSRRQKTDGDQYMRGRETRQRLKGLRMLRIQRLDLHVPRNAPAMRALGVKQGRAWSNVTRPKRRRAVAERVAMSARADWRNARVR